MLAQQMQCKQLSVPLSTAASAWRAGRATATPRAPVPRRYRHTLLSSVRCATAAPALDAAGAARASRRGVLVGGGAALGAAAMGLLTGVAPAARAEEALAVAYFSGGDFRFLEAAFDQLGYLGVKATTVGTLDGVQTVAVSYDSSKLRYEALLAQYWKSINPTEANAQFGDKGPQYRTVVWAADVKQAAAAETQRAKLERSGVFGKGKPLLTEVRELGAAAFSPADEDSQDFAKKNAQAFKFLAGKRRAYKDDVWGPKTNCQGTVCGYVTFGCRDECLDIFAEYRQVD